MRYRDYHVEIEVIERLLGSSPPDPDLYRRYVANRPGDPSAGAGSPEREQEEVASLPPQAADERGLTVFPRDPEGRLHLWDYQIKGALKESANILKEQLTIRALRDKVDNYAYISPRRILLCRNGEPITQPDGIFSRPLRALTMQGPRVSIAASEFLEPPVTLEFQIRLLEHRELSAAVLREILAFGAYKGLGQWRNASWGRFRVLDFHEVGATASELVRRKAD